MKTICFLIAALLFTGCGKAPAPAAQKIDTSGWVTAAAPSSVERTVCGVALTLKGGAVLDATGAQVSNGSYTVSGCTYDVIDGNVTVSGQTSAW